MNRIGGKRLPAQLPEDVVVRDDDARGKPDHAGQMFVYPKLLSTFSIAPQRDAGHPS